MSSKIYYFFSLVFILSSFYVLFIKGYFGVRSYEVERVDVKNLLLKQNNDFNLFPLITKQKVRELVFKNFEDIEDIDISKNYIKFTVKISVTPKKPIFKTNKNLTYIDFFGKKFESNSVYNLKFPEVDITEIPEKSRIFEQSEVDFIKQLYNYPNFKIVCKERYFEIRYNDYDLFYTEVYKVSEPLKVAQILNKEIEETIESKEKKVFLVLDNKIVIKK